MSLPPQTSAHLSDQDRSEMIEQYGGAVDSQFAKTSMMRRIVPVNSVLNTDTSIVRRVGRTQLKALVDGVRPEAAKTNFGRASVTVDTVVIARDNRSMLNEFQTDFNARAELGRDHGKELGKFFDEAFIIQGIKGARLSAPANLNSAIGAGKVETLDAAGDELDPDLLYQKIARIIVRMQEEDIDTEECVIMVRPTQHEVLLNNDKLISRDFSSANGDYALGKVMTMMGSAILPTARIPQTAITDHKLSNANNDNAYNLTAEEANVAAVIIHPHSLLAGETIPLQSDVFFDKVERQWFIDSFYAFGVSNRRPDVCGVVDKFTA